MESYDIRSMTLEQLRHLIASGDDSHHNQIRVSIDGMVYLSQDIVGADQLENVAFRIETFYAGNGYVGQAASADDSHVKPIYNALRGNWENNCSKTYIEDYKIYDYGKYC